MSDLKESLEFGKSSVKRLTIRIDLTDPSVKVETDKRKKTLKIEKEAPEERESIDSNEDAE